MRCRVEHDKRNSISTSNRVLFFLSYKHNSPLLTRKVNFILINENKRIDNPQRKIVNCVGAKRRKCVETLQKQKMDVIFNTLNSHLLSRSLPTEEIFQVNGQNRRVAIPPVVEFPSQPRERLLPRPLRTKLLVFLPVFWFFFPYGFFIHQSH